MKHTPLFDRHVRDASGVINLKGFARAMEYGGHLAEHEAVRSRVSVCDVSHMGELDIEGPDALKLVQKLVTGDAASLATGQVMYTMMLNERGGIIDDLVCYRIAENRFLWVVNVTRTDEDYRWVLQHAAGMDVTVRNVSTDTALIALQGPESREVLQRITKADLSSLEYYWLTQTTIYTAQGKVPSLISRTGYTGERGYEIMIARDLAPAVWDELLLAGRPLGIVPHGVAARESLRTEASYLLNGNDMDAETNPFEAGIGWAVKLSKDFIGRRALEAIEKRGIRRKLVGLEVQGPYTVRHGYPLLRHGKEIGRVTSGPLRFPGERSGSFGLAYAGIEHAEPGTEIEVDVRGRRLTARIVALPLRARRVRDEPAVTTRSPCGLRYSTAHMWARAGVPQENVITLGLSDFGQRDLGTLLCAALPRVGDRVRKGEAAAWVDSYRKTFDIVSPVTGEVVEVNERLTQEPARINAYPYAREGMFKVRVGDHGDYKTLMPFEDYLTLVAKLRSYDVWSSEQRTT